MEEPNQINPTNTNEGEQAPQPETPPVASPPSTSAEGGEKQKDKPLGPVVGVAIIVAIIILGGFYFWSSELSKKNAQDMTGAEILSQDDPALSALQKQGSSDSIADIERDLLNTDLDNIDQELENIGIEVGNI